MSSGDVVRMQAFARSITHGELRGRLIRWAETLQSDVVDVGELLFACENFTPSEAHLLYVIQAGELPAVKIGMTRDLPQRINDIQTYNPAPVRCLTVMPGGSGLESMLHYQLRPLRMHGEWFRLTDEIQSLCRLGQEMLREAAASAVGLVRRRAPKSSAQVTA
jgi:hypothetical protein